MKVVSRTTVKHKTSQGLQTEARGGVRRFIALRRGVFEGVTGRSKAAALSGSARLIYCKGVKGEP